MVFQRLALRRRRALSALQIVDQVCIALVAEGGLCRLVRALLASGKVVEPTWVICFVVVSLEKRGTRCASFRTAALQLMSGARLNYPLRRRRCSLRAPVLQEAMAKTLSRFIYSHGSLPRLWETTLSGIWKNEDQCLIGRLCLWASTASLKVRQDRSSLKKTSNGWRKNWM